MLDFQAPISIIDNLHIRLFAADSTTIDENSWTTRDVQDIFWRFYINNRDGATLELLDEDYPLEARRLYFVPAGVHFNCRADRAIRHFYIHFDVVGLSAQVLRHLFNAPLRLPDSSALEELAKQAANEIGSGFEPALQCRLKALLFLGLAEHWRALPAERRDHYARLTDEFLPVLPALRFIDENLAEPLPNAQLAALCFLSEDYFIRRFGECAGQSPRQYILERRVRVAAQRLLFSSDGIEEIAEQTGFGNRFYFSRVFARQMGVSPAAYRKASRV